MNKNYEDGVYDENTRGHDGHFGADSTLGHKKLDSDSYDKKGFFDGNGYVDNRYWKDGDNTHAVHKPSYFPVAYGGPYVYGGSDYLGGRNGYAGAPVNNVYGVAEGLGRYGNGYDGGYFLPKPVFAHHY